jgi:hypothetical protein
MVGIFVAASGGIAAGYFVGKLMAHFTGSDEDKHTS